MPEEIDIAVAQDLVSGAVGYLPLTPGNKALCTKRQLQECMLRPAQEAYAMGFLSDQKQRFASSERQSWMDIRLDDPEESADNDIRLRPVVVRSLIGAGRRLGDLHDLYFAPL